MKSTLRKIICSILFLFTLTVVQHAQAQPQETREYVTLYVYNDVYAIAYPDGKMEEGTIKPPSGKTLKEHLKTLNDLFNALAKKGYKLKSTVASNMTPSIYYVFRKGITLEMKLNTMKHILTIILAFFSLAALAQDHTITELQGLTDAKQFDRIIELYGSKTKDLSAMSLYFIGHAYYMKNDDNNCLKFMNLSIEKNPKDPAPFYIKASTLNYMKNYEEAIKVFQVAIALNPGDAVYYSGMGDAYYNLGKYELALDAYQKAIAQKNCRDRPYTMIAQVYSDQKNKDKALEAFYVARNKISKESDSYINALYNIGLLESLKFNFDKAEPAFIELLLLAPNDYPTYAKLVQVYYGRKEYSKAKPYKDKLYEAHKKGLLKDNLKDMFCFDQFKWKDKLIQVHERYEEGSEEVYNKHCFYVISPEGKIEFRIQTEYSAMSVELGGSKYLLCMTKGNTHYTFNIGFNDDFKYEDLKKSVIDILEEKVQPAASSRPGK